MAVGASKRCHGAYLGHIIASNYDPTIHMASSLGETLLRHKNLEPIKLFSRYMSICDTEKYQLGNVIDRDYKLWKEAQNTRFTCDEAIIERLVLDTHQQLNELTAGCGPSHRSFPLALCPWISDETLFDISKKEAALTHYSPIAGEVAGMINLICRKLIRGETWHGAIGKSFQTSPLHSDVRDVGMRYTRAPTLFEKTHPAYAPTALVAALHCVTQASDFDQAIKSTSNADKSYSLPIVGILAGVRWGLTIEQCKEMKNIPRIETILQTANDLGNLWSSENISVTA